MAITDMKKKGLTQRRPACAGTQRDSNADEKRVHAEGAETQRTRRNADKEKDCTQRRNDAKGIST